MALTKKKANEREHRNIGIDAKAPKNKCDDVRCPWHGKIALRGRIFSGKVTSTKANKTAIIKWGYTFFIPKYERYERRHSSVTAHVPSCIELKVGDTVRVSECRPLSKTKTFVVFEKKGE
jgi:small subunit ribosomal protein S17